MSIKCCHPCVPPKRYPGCHSTCPEYIAEKAEEDKKREAERKRKEIDNGIRQQRGRGVYKAMRNRKG